MRSQPSLRDSQRRPRHRRTHWSCHPASAPWTPASRSQPRRLPAPRTLFEAAHCCCRSRLLPRQWPPRRLARPTALPPRHRKNPAAGADSSGAAPRDCVLPSPVSQRCDAAERDGGGHTDVLVRARIPTVGRAQSTARSTTSCEATEVSAGTTIRIVDFVFEPAQAEVKVGKTVTWINEGAAAHTSAAYVGGTNTGTPTSSRAASPTPSPSPSPAGSTTSAPSTRR